MRFKDKNEAVIYLKSHPIRQQRRMQIVPVRIWNPAAEEWQDRWDVTLLDTRREGGILRKNRKRKAAKKFQKNPEKSRNVYCP